MLASERGHSLCVKEVLEKDSLLINNRDNVSSTKAV